MVCAKAGGDSAASSCAAAIARSISRAASTASFDPTAMHRDLGGKGRAAQDRLAEKIRRRGVPHDLEGERGKRHADQQFGDADAPAVVRHDAAVGASGEHAAAGDGVAVDRGHHRLGMKEHRVVEPVQRRQKAAHVMRRRPALMRMRSTPAEKIVPCPVSTTALASPPRKLGKARGQRLAEFDVERVGLAVTHGEHGDAVIDGDVDHARTPCAAAPAAARLSRCHSRSACRIAAVNTTIADHLMRQRQRQRRLMQQRDDAERGLQGHRAGQRPARRADRAAAAPGVDGVQHRRQPERIGQHAVVELHGERVLEQIAPEPA